VSKWIRSLPTFPNTGRGLCLRLRDSQRRTYEQLYSRGTNNSVNYTVGIGIGVVVHTIYNVTYSTKYLIYFKKGAEIWGTPIDFSTSINTPSVSQAKITISPNPTRDVLNIETDITFDKINIINLNGQIVVSKQQKQPIMVNDLPNGIYFLQVFDKEILRGVRKFIVNH
jgi:hypothetical protein